MRRSGLGVRCQQIESLSFSHCPEHRTPARPPKSGAERERRRKVFTFPACRDWMFDVLFSRIQWDFPLQQIRIVPKPVRPPSPLRPPRTPKVLTFPARRDWMLGVRFSNPSPFLLAPNIGSSSEVRSGAGTKEEGLHFDVGSRRAGLDVGRSMVCFPEAPSLAGVSLSP